MARCGSQWLGNFIFAAKKKKGVTKVFMTNPHKNIRNRKMARKWLVFIPFYSFFLIIY